MAKKKTQSKPTVKRAAPEIRMEALNEKLSFLKNQASRDQIDPRKELLARVAGNIAGSLVGSPSPSISSAEAIATVAVDIAEQILRKAGVAEPHASETSGTESHREASA